MKALQTTLVIVEPKKRAIRKEKTLDAQSMTEITGREAKTDHLKPPHFDNALVSLHQQGKLKSTLANLFKLIYNPKTQKSC